MIHYADDSVTLHHGDCLDVLRELPDASVDAVVTDPPYGLEFMGREWDSFKPSDAKIRTRVDGRTNGAEKSTVSTPEAYRAGRPFQRWCEAWATECLRILKPGGHLLAFGGSRTWHRLACAVEDAGFEVRDSIAWLYGSGFPKSLDVSKAIDKARHAADDVRKATAWIAAHTTARALDDAAGTNGMGGHWTTQGAQASIPTAEAWERVVHLLPEAPAWLLALIKPARTPGEAWGQREVTGRAAGAANGSVVGLGSAPSMATEYDMTAPATDAARTWQGWGTALKPAFEPIVVGRKPLAGTVAANVLEHGTGALNVAGCRVAHASAADLAESAGKNRHADFGSGPRENRIYGSDNRDRGEGGNYDGTAGRWPTNVILDDSQAAELGGASRFFPTFRYEAKAPTTERPRDGAIAHPTVKPLDLMRWLVRLVTPPGGTVLEPFAGSGTTAEACVLEGFRCIAIEREADYLPLIVQRLSKPLQVGLDIDFGDGAA